MGQARRDYFVQQGLTNPDDPETLVQHLEANPTDAAAVTWTLNQETVAIYAIQPGGPFAAEAYELLRQFLRDQLKEVERVSIPGVVTGKTTLMNGQTVPTVTPAIGGMASWSTAALLKAHLGRTPTKEDQTKVAEISNFIHRVHYELRGLGLAPSERAMNYAATNLFQAREAFESALKQDLRLDSIDAEVSPICRPDSDCWDVVLTFFNPSKRFEQARLAYRFTIDVSDVVPVPIGDPRSWFIY
jgi:cyanobactin maturation PatA/PatG family protease